MKRLAFVLLVLVYRIAGETCMFFDLFYPGYIKLAGAEKSKIQVIKFEEQGKNYTAKVLLEDESEDLGLIECLGKKGLILAVFDGGGNCVRHYRKKDVITTSMGTDLLSKGRNDEAKIYLAKKREYEHLAVISPRKVTRACNTREVLLSPSHVLLNTQVKFEVFSVPVDAVDGFIPMRVDGETASSSFTYWVIKALNYGGGAFFLYAATWNGLVSKKTILGLNMFKLCLTIVSCLNTAHILSFGILFMLEVRQSLQYTVVAVGLAIFAAVLLVRSRDQMVYYKYVIPIYHTTGFLMLFSVQYFHSPVSLVLSVIFYTITFFYLPKVSHRISDTQEWRISVSVAVQFYMAYFCMNGVSPPFSYFAVAWYGINSAFLEPLQSYVIFLFIFLLLPMTAGRYWIVRYRSDQQALSLSNFADEILFSESKQPIAEPEHSKAKAKDESGSPEKTAEGKPSLNVSQYLS